MTTRHANITIQKKACNVHVNRQADLFYIGMHAMYICML